MHLFNNLFKAKELLTSFLYAEAIYFFNKEILKLVTIVNFDQRHCYDELIKF